MKFYDDIYIGGNLRINQVNNAVSNQLTALFYNDNGEITKRVVGDIINSSTQDFIKEITFSFPNIFSLNRSVINGVNNSLTATLVTQTKGTVFAANGAFNSQPSFIKLTSEHLSDANVMFNTHVANTITDSDIARWNNASNPSESFLPLTGGTLTGNLTLNASTVDYASLNIPSGVAPNTPLPGDIWYTASGLTIRIGSTTRVLAHTSQWSEITEAAILSGTESTARFISARRLQYAFDNIPAANAIKLYTPRKINGVSFDGTADITITAAPTAHTHAISDVTALQTTLDGKQAKHVNLDKVSGISTTSVGYIKKDASNNWSVVNDLYSAGNGLTLTGTVFSLSVTSDGSGEIVSAVAQTTSGISVSKVSLTSLLTGAISSVLTTNLSASVFVSTDSNGKLASTTIPLSSITTTKISNWDNAATNSHTHSNKDKLDLINQTLSTTASPTFNRLNLTSSAGSWISGHLSSPINFTAASSATSYFPWMNQSFSDGSNVSVGTLGTNLYFSFATSDNMSTSTNNSTKIVTVNTSGITIVGKIIKSGGTSAQFLKADGSLDENTYITENTARAALVTSTSATGVSNVATTNTNTYLNITQNGASPGSSTQVTGAGSVTVSSDTAGKLTITGADTTYSTGTNTLLTAGTDTTVRVWSANVLKTQLDNYFLTAGGAINGKTTIKTSNTTAGWQNNTVNDANNYIQNNILALTTNNQGLHFFGDYTMNARRMGIQSSHASTGYANTPGILELNPFGGIVRIGSGGLNINGSLNFNNGLSIESQMADGSIKHFKNNATNLYNNSVAGTYASYQTFTSSTTAFSGTTLTLTHKSGTTLTVSSSGTSTAINKIFSISGYVKINNVPPTADVWTATPITSQGGGSSIKNYYDEATGYFECVHQYKSATGWLIHKAIATLVVNDVITLTNLTFVEDITPLDWKLGLLDLKYLIDGNYSAGNGLTLSGTTFSLPVTQSGSGNAVTAVTQGTNGLTVTKADTFLKKLEPVVGLLAATYSNASLVSTQKSKLRITLPFKTSAGVMLGFTIRLYGTYRFMDIQCAGYLYSSPNNWYLPSAVVSHDIGGNGTGNNFDVTFGRDEDGYAYVTIPNFDYIGVAVLNVVRGYSASMNSPIVATLDWTITQNEDTPNIASTLNIGIRESIPVATTTLKGLVKVGANLSITADGTLSSTYTNTTYTAGSGLTLSGTTFSLPVTQSGSGNAVTAVAQGTNGITVTKGSTFSLDGHTHDSIIGTKVGASTDINTTTANTTAERVTWYSNINHNTTNNFPTTNNANGILHLSTHLTDHWQQLGFSSNGNIYHRYTTGNWSQIITDKDTTRLNDSNHMNYYFNVSVNTASPLPFQDYDNTSLTAYVSGKTYPAFEVSMNVTATGTVTGTKYILYINSNTWEVIKIGNATDTSSNHPVLFVDTDGIPKIKMASHATKYPVACFVRRLNVSNNIFNVKRLFGLTFDSLLDTPTTLSGYGITDAGISGAVTNTATSTTDVASTSNGSTFINRMQGGVIKESVKFVGAGSVSITHATGGIITVTGTNTTYTAGNGLTLSGTAFSLPVTDSGSGNYVSNVVASTNGLTVTKATLPTPALVTSTSATGVSNVATTNTNTYLNVTQGGASPGSSTQITGAGSVTVTSDANGKLTITGTDTNTTYSAGTTDILITGTDTTARLWSPSVLDAYMDDTLAISRVKTKYTATANLTTKALIRLNITTIGYYFIGHLKVSFTSSYSNANANGVVVIEGGIGSNSSSIWNNQLTCTLAQGNFINNFYVDPVMKWDATNKQLYLEIHKKASSGNALHVKVEYFGTSQPNLTPSVVISATDTSIVLTNQQTITSGLSVISEEYNALTLRRNSNLGTAIAFQNIDKTLGSLTYDASNVFRVMSGSTEAIRADTSGIVSTAFKKTGSSDAYMLLGDGSHKLLSDFTDTSGTTWFTKSLSPVGSYISFVIPLFEYEENAQNGAKGHINANFHFRRSNGLSGLTDNVRVIGGDTWENTPQVMFESTNTTLTLVSFTWNAKKYIGIRWIGGASHDRAIKGYGFAQDESIIQRISYANSNTGEVLNTEINSSIAEYTPPVTKTNKLNYHQTIKTLTVDNSISFSQNDGAFIDNLGYTRIRLASGGTVISGNSNSIYFRPSDTSSTQVTIDASANISATTFKKIGGTSAQFLKADGSVDATVYTTDAKAKAALITSTSATGVSNVATTNTNTYLNITQNGASPGSSTQVTGAGSVTVSSDTAGKLTITGTNTTYTAGNGLTLSGTAFSLPVTDSGSGNYVSNVVASTNGLTVTKATLPTPALITSTSATGVSNVATTNTNTYLNVTQGGASPGSSTQITGAGSVTVTSDTAGKLTITGVDTNTTYSAGTNALLTAGTDTTARLWTAAMFRDFLNNDVNNDVTFTTANSLFGRSKFGLNSTSGTETGDITIWQQLISMGFPLFDDPEFKNGLNSVTAYNNSSGSLTLITDTQTSNNASGKVINIKLAALNANGFVHSILSKANAQQLQVFRAKLPVGFRFMHYNNVAGDSAKHIWLTDTRGTDKWEWYVKYTVCGASGTFSTHGHVGVIKHDTTLADPTSAAPIDIFISFANAYELTKEIDTSLQTKKLYTPRKINGVSFDGTADITITADPTTHTHTFASLTSKPTTLSGYGITDAGISGAVTNTATSTTDVASTSNGSTFINRMQGGVIKESVKFVGAGSVSITHATGGIITVTGTNTTYTAGNGLTLSGTAFSLPVTDSGSGNYVSNVVASSTGLTVTKATLPTPALVTSTSATGVSNVATTNTNTYLNVTQGGASPGSSTQITGAGSVTVTSDANGKLTITGTNTNTTYTAGNGLTLSGTAFSLPVTDSGSGNYVSNVVASSTGLTVTKATLPTPALVTSTSATGVSNVATTNTNTYLNVTQGGASPGTSTQITGAGSVTVTSDTAGKLTITGVDTNTTYEAGTETDLSGSTDNGNSKVWAAKILTSHFYTLNGGTLYGAVYAPAFYETSLRKYKTNIKDFTLSGIELVNSLDIVTFDRIESETQSKIKHKIGVIADDTRDEFLSENKDAVDLYKTTFIQAKAIQELTKKNEVLENELKEIKEMLQKLLK